MRFSTQRERGCLKSLQSRAESKFLAPLFALLLVEEMLQSSDKTVAASLPATVKS